MRCGSGIRNTPVELWLLKHAHARTEHLLSVWRPVGLCWIYRLPATFNLLYALAMANVANIYCHSKYFKSLKRHKSRYSNSSGNTFKWFKCSRLCQVFRPCPFSSSLSLFPIILLQYVRLLFSWQTVSSAQFSPTDCFSHILWAQHVQSCSPSHVITQGSRIHKTMWESGPRFTSDLRDAKRRLTQVETVWRDLKLILLDTTRISRISLSILLFPTRSKSHYPLNLSFYIYIYLSIYLQLDIICNLKE